MHVTTVNWSEREYALNICLIGVKGNMHITTVNWSKMEKEKKLPARTKLNERQKRSASHHRANHKHCQSTAITVNCAAVTDDKWKEERTSCVLAVAAFQATFPSTGPMMPFAN